MPKVNEHLSDLFFNHDVDSAKKPDHLGGGFDPDLLVEEADQFLSNLKGFCQSIGCPTGAVFPEADDLVEDFLGRI